MIAKKKDTSLTKFLSPYFRICTVCGLNNIYAGVSHPTTCQKISKYTYSIFFIVVYCALLYIGYCDIGEEFNSLMRVELVLKVFVGNLTGVIMVACGLVNQRKFVATIRSMEIREKELIKHARSSMSTLRIKLFTYGQLLFLFVVQACGSILTYFKHCRHEDNQASCIGSWLAINLCPSISHIHSVMFSTLTLIIKRQFTLMNHLLLETGDVETKGMVKMHQTTSRRLLLLKNLHSHLIFNSKQINYIFSIPILFKFLDGFLLIFCCIHSFITGFNAPELLRPYATKSNLLPVSTALVAVTELLSIILTCQSASTETAQTAIVLHKLYKREKHLIKSVRTLQTRSNTNSTDFTDFS